MEYFERELDELKQSLLTMGSHAEAAVNRALLALMERDDDLAVQVLREDQVLDQYELDIDDRVIHFLAKAPLASDLRLTTMIMKISQELERVGDEASKIAKRARDLNQEPPLKINVDLPRIARLALEMLKEALDAFVNRNPDDAREIIQRDKQVDALNRQINDELLEFMIANTGAIKRCMDMIVVSKSLERIADHAKNVAEDVVFLCEATDVRHLSLPRPGVEPRRAAGG